MHALLHDGHASHLTVIMLRFAMENIGLFKLPSHSCQATQPLDVFALGILESNQERPLEVPVGEQQQDACEG